MFINAQTQPSWCPEIYWKLSGLTIQFNTISCLMTKTLRAKLLLVIFMILFRLSKLASVLGFSLMFLSVCLCMRNAASYKETCIMKVKRWKMKRQTEGTQWFESTCFRLKDRCQDSYPKSLLYLSTPEQCCLMQHNSR